jgi:hypothetical protein
MATLHTLRPSDLAPFSLGRNWHPDNGVPRDDHQLILVVVEGRWSEPDGNGDCHTRRDISRMLVGILDASQHELLLLERGDLDSLDVP